MKKGNVIYVCVTLVLMAIPIFTDFVRMGFSSDFFTDAEYWLGVIGVQIPIILLMFVSRSHGEWKEKDTNTEYAEFKDTVQRGYARINTAGQSKAFAAYVDLDNMARKLSAYVSRLEGKITAVAGKITRAEDCLKRREMRLTDLTLRRGRDVKERNPLYMLLCAFWRDKIRRSEQKKRYLETRLSTAERDVRHVKVRYARITVSGIFGNAEKTHAEEFDISTHKGRSLAAMVLSKAVGIAAFGILATSSVVFEKNADVVSIIYKTVVKIAQMIVSIYFGLIAGRQFVRSDLIDSYRKRVTYLQQFFDTKTLA